MWQRGISQVCRTGRGPAADFTKGLNVTISMRPSLPSGGPPAVAAAPMAARGLALWARDLGARRPGSIVNPAPTG